jgi:nucleoside-diphosphate-sugar epimerase
MKTKPGHVVYFSSSAAYPIDLQNDWAITRTLVEQDIKIGGNIGRPDQTYGLAKLVGEVLAEEVSSAGIPVHVFRPFTGYAGDQDPEYPFRAFLDRALAHDDPFEIWGDGRQTRDFIHISDIVAAVFSAIDQDVRGPVNLCTGVATDFSTLARMMTSQAGYHPQLKYLTDKPVGVQYRVGNPDRMLRYFEPTISLAEGIAMALKDWSTP